MVKTDYFWEKLLISIAIIYFSILFYQNFIYSSTLELLAAREIDDMAFQFTLREIHEFLTSAQFYKAFNSNRVANYGYGWVYWFPMAIITLPFYFLSTNFGVDWPLIIIPRQISLILSFASVFLFYKILKIYTKDKFNIFAFCIIFMLLPSFGYFSMRFGTVAQVMFFSMLSFYFVASSAEITRQTMRNIGLSLAACAGTKLSGLLIAPVVGLMLISRTGIPKDKASWLLYLYLALVFIGSFIIFANPALVISPFVHHIFSRYIQNINYFLHNVHNGNNTPILERFTGATTSNFGHMYLLPLCVLGFLSNLLNKKDGSKDLIIIFACLLFLYLFLIFFVESAVLYISLYFTSIIFLVILGLSGFYGKISRPIVAFTLISFIFLLPFGYKNTPFQPLAYFQKYESQAVLIDEMMLIKTKIDADNLEKLLIYQDFTLPQIYGGLKDKNKRTMPIYYNLGDNLTFSPDFIIFDKNIPSFDEEKLKEHIKNESETIKKTLIEDRNLRVRLLDRGVFNNSRYKVVYQSDRIIVFQKKIL